MLVCFLGPPSGLGPGQMFPHCFNRPAETSQYPDLSPFSRQALNFVPGDDRRATLCVSSEQVSAFRAAKTALSLDDDC